MDWTPAVGIGRQDVHATSRSRSSTGTIRVMIMSFLMHPLRALVAGEAINQSRVIALHVSGS